MLEFRILGSLEVWKDGVAIPLGGGSNARCSTLLLLEAGRVVSTDRLIDALWGERPPRTAATSLQNLVSQLRKLLGPEVLVTKPSGYQLDVAPGQLDLERFRLLVDEARRAPPEAPRRAASRGALTVARTPFGRLRLRDRSPRALIGQPRKAKGRRAGRAARDRPRRGSPRGDRRGARVARRGAPTARRLPRAT